MASKSEKKVSPIEEQIVVLAKREENGISNDDIKKEIPNVPPAEWTKVINKLLKNG